MGYRVKKRLEMGSRLRGCCLLSVIQARSRGLSKDREASEVRTHRRVLCVG